MHNHDPAVLVTGQCGEPTPVRHRRQRQQAICRCFPEAYVGNEVRNGQGQGGVRYETKAATKMHASGRPR